MSFPGEYIRNRAVSLSLWDVVTHIFFALFLVLFLTELDRELIRHNWLPVPGGGIVLYCGGMMVVLLCLGVAAGRARTNLLCQAAAIARHYWLFALAFWTLLVLSLGNWFRNPAADFGDALLIVLPAVVCAGAALLPLISHVRHGWRTFLGLAFVVWFLIIWVDVWTLGAISEYEGRAAGFVSEPTEAAMMVMLLAIPLLQSRRFGLVSLIVLYMAGLAVFPTFSRGGALVYMLLTASYLFLAVVRSPGRRLNIFFAFGAMAALLVFSAWLSVQSFEFFSLREAQYRLGFLTGERSWLFSCYDASDADAIESELARYANFWKMEVPWADPNDVRKNVHIEDGVACIPNARLVRVLMALSAIEASPILGHGTRFNTQAGIDCGNMYLSLWVDLGLLGFLGLIGFLGTGFLAFHRLKYWPGVFLIGFLACWCLFSHNVLDFRPPFIVLGLLLSLALREPEEGVTGICRLRDDGWIKTQAQWQE